MDLITEFEINNLNPNHYGYPEWPGGYRWLQLYDLDSGLQLVVTKGLSDNHLSRYEIYLETDELLNCNNFSSSWQANLVYEAGKIIPNVPNLEERLNKNKYLCLQIQIDGAPPEWSINDSNGNIGLFAGLENDNLSDFNQAFIPLNIKLMRPEELMYCIQHDRIGRNHLAELYKEQENSTVSNLYRKSVIN